MRFVSAQHSLVARGRLTSYVKWKCLPTWYWLLNMSLFWHATHCPTALVLQATSTRHIYWRQLHMRNTAQYHAELLMYRSCTHIGRDSKSHDRNWGCIKTWARVKRLLLTEYLCEQKLASGLIPKRCSCDAAFVVVCSQPADVSFEVQQW